MRALRSTDQERKLKDTTIDGIMVSTTDSTFTVLNLVNAGEDNFERIGRKLAMRSLMLNLSMLRNPNNTEKAQFVRIWIILDKQANGTLPTVSQLLDLPGSGFTQIELQSPNNINNSKRFQTLWHKRFTLQKDFKEGIQFKKFLRLNQTVQYNSTAGLIDDIKTNSLLLLGMSDQTTVSGFGAALLGTIRLRFVG